MRGGIGIGIGRGHGKGVAPPPPAPTDLTATALSSTAIRLTWTTGGGTADWAIERSLDGATWTQIGTVPGGATEATDNTLAPETAYHFRVRAFNSAGYSAYSNTASATTRALADPVALPWSWDGADGLDSWTSTGGDVSLVSFDGGLGLRLDGSGGINRATATRDHDLPETGVWSLRFRLAIEAEATDNTNLLSTGTPENYDSVAEINVVPGATPYLGEVYARDVSYTSWQGDPFSLTVGQVYTIEQVYDPTGPAPTLTTYRNGVAVSTATDELVGPAAEGFNVGSTGFNANQGLIYTIGSVSIADHFQGI